MRRLALLCFAALLAPAGLAAQTCLGNPSFRVNHLQLAGEALFDENVTTFGAMFTGGSNSYFGGLGAGGASTDGVDGTTLLVRGQVGSQVPVSASGAAQVCPILTAELGFGPDDIDGLGTNYGSRAFGFGLALGGVMASTGMLELVPSISAGFQYRAGIFDAVGGSTTVSDTYGTVGAALGLVMNQSLALRPSVTLPVGIEDAKPIFGIGVTLNYGGRR